SQELQDVDQTTEETKAKQNRQIEELSSLIKTRNGSNPPPKRAYSSDTRVNIVQSRQMLQDHRSKSPPHSSTSPAPVSPISKSPTSTPQKQGSRGPPQKPPPPLPPQSTNRPLSTSDSNLSPSAHRATLATGLSKKPSSVNAHRTLPPTPSKLSPLA